MDMGNRPFKDFAGNDRASREVLNALEVELGSSLPADYRDFLLCMNGGEGFFGRQYLILWRAEELLRFNRDYEVAQYAPGLLLFGSSGGGEAFGYRMVGLEWPVVQVPFVGLDLRYAKPVARSFSELLLRMCNSNGSLL